MDKLLTEFYLRREMKPDDRDKVLTFLNKFAPWQRRVLRKFYWHGPQFVENRYNVDIYNMLTNMGILEVE